MLVGFTVCYLNYEKKLSLYGFAKTCTTFYKKSFSFKEAIFSGVESTSCNFSSVYFIKAKMHAK